MTKLTDTQLVILSAACQRPGRLVLPLPAHIKGGAVQKVVAGLLSRGLVEEVEAGRDAPLWREVDGHGVTLVASDAAFDALGVGAQGDETGAAEGLAAGATSAADPAAAEACASEADDAASEGEADEAAQTAAMAAVEAEAAQEPGPAQEASTGAPRGRSGARKVKGEAGRTARPDSKQARLIAMLERPEGATIAQIVEATGWQPHTVRGAFAGALKKRLGLNVTSEKVDGTRVYKIER